MIVSQSSDTFDQGTRLRRPALWVWQPQARAACMVQDTDSAHTPGRPCTTAGRPYVDVGPRRIGHRAVGWRQYQDVAVFKCISVRPVRAGMRHLAPALCREDT